MPSATPADVLARRRHVILTGDADGFADLFAPDAVIEVPFAGPPGLPVRLAGREEIRESARQMLESPLRLENFEVVELHQTRDFPDPRGLEDAMAEPRPESRRP
jgi:hypothetical protein